MKKLISLLVIIGCIPLVFAAEPGGAALDNKIQNLKKEVMKLNRDLFILEEELLFPTSTQVAVFFVHRRGELL
jgi:hypothetical protein